MENITKGLFKTPYPAEKIDVKLWQCKVFVETEEHGLVFHATTYGNSPAEAYENAQLIADAGNTFNKCGLTPSELLEQRDELFRMANYLYNNLEMYADGRNGSGWSKDSFKKELEALNKTQPINTQG